MTQMMFPGMKRLPKTKINKQPETDSTPAIMMPTNALHRALAVNQFKNAFDDTSEAGVGGKRSGYMVHRKNAEEEAFNVPRAAPPEERPIYGYLDDKTNSLSGDLETYGDVNVHIKWPEPGKNVTTTLGDSLNNYGSARTRGKKKYAPKKLDPKIHKAVQPDIDFFGSGIPYREVQWHDHPSPREDITAVNLSASAHNPSYNPLYDDRKHILERHKELAQHFRAAGLSHTTPVISKITYHKQEERTLYDAHPEAIKHLPIYPRLHLPSKKIKQTDVREL